jgi:hypothetical protein
MKIVLVMKEKMYPPYVTATKKILIKPQGWEKALIPKIF